MNSPNIKFSVVIPLYDKAPYIVAAVNSVLAQTFQDFEVVVVDDGSDDGGAELVEAIADPRVSVVRQVNAGVSAARNTGISRAGGEWVAFLDADDWLHPHYLATLVDVQNKHPGADTVAADHLLVGHSEGMWPPTWPATDDSPAVEVIEDLPFRWMVGPCLCSSAVAVRRSQLLRMQPCFPVGESRGEDLDLWFRLGENSPIALAHTPLAAYRRGIDGSLSADRRTVMMEPFMWRMQKRALSGALTPKQRRSSLRLVGQFMVSMARQSIAAGNRLEGLRWLLKGRHAITSRRWWLTAVMAVLVPSQWVRKWEVWRINRTANVI